MSILNLMNPVGSMIISLLPYAFIDDSESLDSQRKGFFMFMVCLAVIAAVSMILTFMFSFDPYEVVKGDPERASASSVTSQPKIAATELLPIRGDDPRSSPDSPTASPDKLNFEGSATENQSSRDPNQDEIARSTSIPMKLQYKILFKDCTYISMFVVASISGGMIGVFGAILPQIVVIWGMGQVTKWNLISRRLERISLRLLCCLDCWLR